MYTIWEYLVILMLVIVQKSLWIVQKKKFFWFLDTNVPKYIPEISKTICSNILCITNISKPKCFNSFCE